jgi:hypothetical protein
MHTSDRDDDGQQWLRGLHAAIDAGNREEAQRLYDSLVARWGPSDPALIRAKGLID